MFPLGKSIILVISESPTTICLYVLTSSRFVTYLAARLKIYVHNIFGSFRLPIPKLSRFVTNTYTYTHTFLDPYFGSCASLFYIKANKY